MTEHSFGCLSDQEAMGLHDLSKAEVYQKPKGVTMFEKEAEERITEQYGTSGEYITRQRIWQDGAEFGYNKANEWHYVKDGKYPTDEKDDVEVLYQDCDKINVYNCVYDIHAENWLYYNLDDMMLELFPYHVIAWKEIVLPELKESE